MHSVLMDDACILKTHVFMQRWCDIAIVVFIIKSPHLAYSVDNRQHSTSASTSAFLNIGTIGHRNNRLNVTSVKLYPRPIHYIAKLFYAIKIYLFCNQFEHEGPRKQLVVSLNLTRKEETQIDLHSMEPFLIQQTPCTFCWSSRPKSISMG